MNRRGMTELHNPFHMSQISIGERRAAREYGAMTFPVPINQAQADSQPARGEGDPERQTDRTEPILQHAPQTAPEITSDLAEETFHRDSDIGSIIDRPILM
ncbi:MAG: hypothetical protein Tsb008_09220 [Rhodothalassiaceae bacterium]